MNTRLKGWKEKLLTQAGKITLIQSVLAAIPTHSMQLNYLPTTTRKYIDRIQRDFLWGSTVNKKRLLLVNWDTVTSLKQEGVLGLSNSKGKNLALLCNILQRLYSSPNSLWVQVLGQKYLARRDNNKFISKNTDSYVWKNIIKEHPFFLEGLVWNVATNGRHISLWKDKWILVQLTLRELIQGPLTNTDCTEHLS